VTDYARNLEYTVIAMSHIVHVAVSQVLRLQRPLFAYGGLVHEMRYILQTQDMLQLMIGIA